MSTEPIELSSFFEQVELDAEAVDRYTDAAHASFLARERFGLLINEHAEAVRRGQGDPLKLGLGYYILGQYGEAITRFAEAADGKLRRYYAAESAAALGRLDDALAEFQQARQRGWDALNADMRIAEIHVRAGDLESARNLVRQHEQQGRDRAGWYFARGVLAEAEENSVAAAEAYERALVLDPEHVPTLFRAARLYDMLGDDEQALELYDRLTRKPRAHVNALINAAVIYEDIGRFDRAMHCLRRVLKAHPNHARARLFLKDVESCQEMVIDEVGEETYDARSRLMEMPLTEFELSVRARNCLKKMNIRTLGELVGLSEAELLAGKNFGETSLNEIKALLDKKGLRLGQRPDEIDLSFVEEATAQRPPQPPGQEAILSKPVSELELSVRSRRCLQRLNVHTLGDLVQLSEQELLATRNFGVTSLTEIRARLGEHNLQLAPKKAGT